MVVGTRPRPDVSINLLPPQIRSLQRARRRLTLAAGGALALAVLLVGIAVMQRFQISSAEDTLSEERARAAALKTRVDGLKEFDALQQSIEGSRRTLATALASDISWSRFLDDLDTVMPADSWVGTLTLSAQPGQTPTGEASHGTAQYQGFVVSFPGLSGWLDTMSDLDGLRFVYLQTGKKSKIGEQSVVSFSASAHLTETMLSHRCQREGAPCP